MISANSSWSRKLDLVMTNLKLLTANPILFGMKKEVRLDWKRVSKTKISSSKFKDLTVIASGLRQTARVKKLYVFKVFLDLNNLILMQSINYFILSQSILQTLILLKILVFLLMQTLARPLIFLGEALTMAKDLFNTKEIKDSIKDLNGSRQEKDISYKAAWINYALTLQKKKLRVDLR